jgi:hypothetical protein
MTRIILRTRHNGIYTGVLKPKDSTQLKDGIFVELDSKTGLSLWCPNEQIDECIEVPIEGKKKEK